MLTWSDRSTTGEHFAFLRDYKPRINEYTNSILHYINGIFSDPDHTGTDDTTRDKISTQESHESEESDVIPSVQGLVQCTEGMYFPGINY